jgi:hypothetical protein
MDNVKIVIDDADLETYYLQLLGVISKPKPESEDNEGT